MTTQAWIIIAAVAAVLLVVLVAGFLRYRKGQVSLKAPETKPELGAPEKDKSGGYKAGGGFNFSQGSTATAPPPVVPTPPVAEKPPVVEEPVVEKKPIVEEPVAEKPAVVEEPAVEEPAVVEEPVVEEPVVEEPVIEKPVVEEPAVAEPVVEEPVVPEPVEPAPRVLDEIDPTEVGWTDCAGAFPARSQQSARACWVCSVAAIWTRIRGKKSRTPSSSQTSAPRPRKRSSRSFVSRWRPAASGPSCRPRPTARGVDRRTASRTGPLHPRIAAR